MKRTTNLLLLCLLTTVTNAQFNVGQKVLSGNISFSTNKQENVQSQTYSTKNSAFFFSPSIAWAAKTNQLTGVGLYYSRLKSVNSNTGSPGNQTSEGNSVGLSFYKQRFFPIVNKFYFTVQGSAGAGYRFGETVTTTTSPIREDKTTGYEINFGLAPGISYRLRERLLMDLSLTNFIAVGYNHDETKRVMQGSPNYTATTSNFYLSSGLSNTALSNVGLGFRWLLK